MKNILFGLALFSVLINFSKGDTPNEDRTPLGTIFNDQTIYYISSNNVKVKSTPDDDGKTLGTLSLNDKVKLINPSVISAKNFIEVSIEFTYDPISKSEKYFINIENLSPTLVDYKEFTGKYFVVVNIATETLRMYERICEEKVCHNKMIFETEVVVGEDVNHPKDQSGKGRSILGSYRVIGWSKFYQDSAGHYPAWYRKGYPETPGPDAKWNAWFSRKIMPLNDDGKVHGVMRGAFGWFTAFTEPEPFGQWTHGTIGWGSDKDKYIKKVKTPLINVVSDPRSSGCTRNNNEAIAFIREMIDIGAPIIKIYAKEKIFDSELSNYPNETAEWNYVMTKNKSHVVDREDVLNLLGVSSHDLDVFWEAKKAGGELILDPESPLNQVLEAGSYVYDAHPDAITYSPGENLGKFERKLGRKGNVYGVKDKNMHGIFYIDTGLLDDYNHPDEILETSGFEDEVTPPWMQF